MKLFILSIALSSGMAMAETLTTSVHSVEKVPGSETTLVKFTNGRVAFLNEGDSALTEVYASVGSSVVAEVDEKSSLQSMSVLKNFIDDPETPVVTPIAPAPSYEPTVLNGFDEAQAFYNRMNPRFKRVSECSDRAHVWSYDEFMRSGIKSQKVFAFFTATYIKKNAFKWWFHVAPLVSVNENGSVQTRVMDYQYLDRPVLIKEWTDSLVFSKRACKFTTKFSEYDVNPQTEDCYLMIDSMYYHFPAELSAQEKGQYRTQFNDFEVKGARARAFRTGDL